MHATGSLPPGSLPHSLLVPLSSLVPSTASGDEQQAKTSTRTRLERGGAGSKEQDMREVREEVEEEEEKKEEEEEEDKFFLKRV